MTLTLNPESIDLATLRQLWEGAPIKLDDASMSRVRAAAASVERFVAGGETVHGINTPKKILSYLPAPMAWPIRHFRITAFGNRRPKQSPKTAMAAANMCEDSRSA